MPVIVKNLAAVADAPLSTHTLPFVSQFLLDRANSAKLFVVAHRWTNGQYSTTVYDVLGHRLYRAMHPKSVRSWLQEIARERGNIRVLKTNEAMHLQIYEDDRITVPTFV